jgi:hypothetical protein
MHQAEAHEFPPMTDRAAGERLEGARSRALAAYTKLRQFLPPADAPRLDSWWQTLLAGMSGRPALIRLNSLLAFADEMDRQIVGRERGAIEAEQARHAVEAERHKHALDGVVIGAPYAADRDFTQFIDGVTLSCRKGAVLRDHILIAKLIAAGAPVSIAADDGDPVVACQKCGHEFRRSEGTIRPTGRAA